MKKSVNGMMFTEHTYFDPDYPDEVLIPASDGSRQWMEHLTITGEVLIGPLEVHNPDNLYETHDVYGNPY